MPSDTCERYRRSQVASKNFRGIFFFKKVSRKFSILSLLYHHHYYQRRSPHLSCFSALLSSSSVHHTHPRTQSFSLAQLIQKKKNQIRVGGSRGSGVRTVGAKTVRRILGKQHVRRGGHENLRHHDRIEDIRGEVI
jgi:hypothetical protein